MLEAGGSRPGESRGELAGGDDRASLLARLHEPVDRRDRLDLTARLTAIAAGLAVLAVLPFDLYTVSFVGGHGQGYAINAWGQLSRLGGLGDIGYQPPVYGYVLAPTAVVVVLTAWTHPRCVTLALAVLAGCAAVLLADLRSVATPDGVHLAIGPLLPVLAGAVVLAGLARLVAWMSRPASQTAPGSGC